MDPFQIVLLASLIFFAVGMGLYVRGFRQMKRAVHEDMDTNRDLTADERQRVQQAASSIATGSKLLLALSVICLAFVVRVVGTAAGPAAATVFLFFTLIVGLLVYAGVDRATKH